MQSRIAPVVQVIAMIVVVFLTLAAPYVGLALSAALTVANRRTPPWRTAYLVLTVALILGYLFVMPASVGTSD